MSQIIERIKAEPVLVTTLVASLLSLLVAFGVPLSDEQSAAIIAAIVAISALVVRGKVSPV